MSQPKPKLQPPPNDEERWLRALLQLLDAGLVQVARNTIWARLVCRFGRGGRR